ncbi:MAG TPA: hypothetical protein VG738_14365 [Chitinophagaceae bacterium]|nr:hypothetical protein [Chitinophagaceae bacterium]
MAKGEQKPTRNKHLAGITFSIARIDLTNSVKKIPSTLNSQEFKDFRFEVETDFKLFPTTQIIQIIISYDFYLLGDLLLSMQVENDFKISNFADVVINNDIPDKEFLIFLVGISLNHSRGIQSVITKDTPISNFYIPPISRDKILNKFKK